MAEAVDFASALLAADPDTRLALLRDADAETLHKAIEQLGHRHESSAGEVLALIDATVTDRDVRKSARRAVHRLRSAGINVQSIAQVPPSAQTPSAQGVQVRLSHAWATDVDPTGSRAVWLIGERSLGGVWFGSVLLNDLSGLEDINVVDTTRKRVTRELDERRRAGTWVELPPSYALALVRESVDVARERGAGLPTRYRAFKDAFGEAPGAPARPLVYETVSPLQTTFTSETIEHTGRLLMEPELGGWHIPAEDADGLHERALEIVRQPFAALLVTAHPPEEQALALVAEVAQRTLTPSTRRALRRRLEETGYIFVATDRLASARLAVVAARGIDDPQLPPERHPLLRLLLAAGIARLLRSDSVGNRAAPDMLVELVERGAEQADSGRAVEARPSGLILPR